MNRLNPSRNEMLSMALMYLLFGLVLCFFSGSILTTIVRVLGILLVVYGGYNLYQYFVITKSTNLSPMVIGIPGIIIGLILAVWPHMLINFFPIVAGVLLTFNSITQIQKSLVLKRAGISSWMLSMVAALIMLFIGIILMIRPSSVINMIMSFTGIALIAEAVILTVQAFIKA
ncbi:DUF308 domain-containing protein [Allobaculum sp. JKK-2023]|uniref:DUF308 domain-containing protein n=1 Tax=Allobaculum sp. JKK-2023 TaxID=3108943 RepID=UPI002B0597BA|nr:DUF308 domain-containing protein [Allobaculum sp. JKK-2023]